ncbi:N-acetyltransferase [Glycomyces buryatensis]|uniref:N-acetyltransferase n=1 Tax=Glycomyces buryatensis TaxID=2570927 RepID=A0A4S8QAN8_9ACTN|nr:N-acetyltransferase [Glycomyces buryatensis]
MSIVDNPKENRYELREEDGGISGYLEYLIRDEFVVLPHTEVDRSLRGGGWGGKLAQFALDDLKTKGAKAYPTCPFVERWMDRHPEYNEVRYRP